MLSIIFVTGMLNDCVLQSILSRLFTVSPVIWLKKIAGHCGKLYHPTDLSVSWAERLEYEATKQIIIEISAVNIDHYAS